MTPQQIFNAKLKADADKRKAKIKAQFLNSGLSRKDFAKKMNMSRQNLERMIK